MTTITLVQRHMQTSFGKLFRVSVYPLADGRFVSLFLFASAIAVVVVYFIALYTTFGIGFQIQEYSSLYADRAEKVQEIELALQQKEMHLANEYESLLQSMETVSSINYISPSESVAVKNNY